MGNAVKIITSIEHMRENSTRLRDQGDRIGFVPTMGYLHEGHASLMRKAREENHALVASIFVNPTQFGPGEDFSSYPRDLERDAKLCRGAGADILFTPTAEEMYPAGHCTKISVAGLTEGLCGASRPGHFDGVTTVVAKLFEIVRPSRAYFGLKDYQQYRVIARMARDLDMGVEVVGLPTVREPDGLAMSSRNVYLDPAQHKSALSLSRALAEAQGMVDRGVTDPSAVTARAREVILAAPGTRIDYVQIVDPEDLGPITAIKDNALLALAVRIGKARLIDNAILTVR